MTELIPNELRRVREEGRMPLGYFSRSAEFQGGRDITLVKFDRVPTRYRTKDGKINRYTFLDHEVGIERVHDNDSFSLETALLRAKKNERGILKATKNEVGRDSWSWTPKEIDAITLEPENE